LLVEDSETFSRFCDDEDVTKRLAAFEYSSNSIRRTLGQLAALGLIAKVTHPRLGVPINDGGLLTAFRPLREGENTRLGDVEALRRAVDGAKADVVAETNA
jgi:type I restriction enzyme S subunit